jgi:PadR family transcriptional regulator, regulatory protein PadR
MKFNDLLTGFIRLHILHHAAEQEIYGQWMIDELARHGYRLSPGTLYPMLHAMERNGYLTSRMQRDGRVGRKLYKATRQTRARIGKAPGSGIYRRSDEALMAGAGL